MFAPTVSIIVLLLCNCIASNDLILSRAAIPTPTSDVEECTVASECISNKLCASCPAGHSPTCTTAECVNKKCKLITPCSLYTPTTTTIADGCKEDGQCVHPTYCAVECKEGLGPLCATAKCVNKKCQTISPCSQKSECTTKDTSRCATPQICARCKPGYSPGCAQTTCENGLCKTIEPCSLYTSTSTSSVPVMDDPSTTPSSYQCQTDGECAYVKQCVKECNTGTGPLCAYSNCINRKCVITAPCSQKSECTDTDLSHCVVPQLCERCITGYSPSCAQASCENGQCKTIAPCSVYVEPTPKPVNTCTCDDDCPSSKLCEVKCPADTTPVCASSKCVDGECITIKPCSQQICKTKATCPYNKQNCVPCPFGYGPGCEQAACSCGICTIVPPCSKKIKIIINNLATQATLKSIK